MNKPQVKIYFACSIRGGRDDAPLYRELVNFLREEAIVLTELFAAEDLTEAGMAKADAEIRATDVAWIREADAIIAEVTNPSLGVGYEIAKAEEWGKPVLALFRPAGGRRLSAMIAGSPQTRSLLYADLDEAKPAIREFLASI